MTLSLFDLLAPSFLIGFDLGPGIHGVLESLLVTEVESTWAEDHILLWGTAKVKSGIAPSHTVPPGAVWTWHDSTVPFRLTAERRPSATVAGIVDPLTAVTGFVVPSWADLFKSFGSDKAADGASDFPGSAFRLELLLSAASVHLPFLAGARLDARGLLEADPAHPDVEVVLPRVLIAITQDEHIATSLKLKVASWGAESLDDEAGGALVEMRPPYALIGGSPVLGFGFRKAVLDLSDEQTPPDLLALPGIGDDWQGLYLREVRLFVAPSGATGFAFDAVATDLLIGLGSSAGITGTFRLDAVNQGKKLEVDARFYDAEGDEYTLIPSVTTGDKHSAFAVLPELADTTVVVDVRYATPPYVITIDGIEVSTTGQRAVVKAKAAGVQISVTDSATPPNRFDLAISVTRFKPPAPLQLARLTPSPPTKETQGHSISLVAETVNQVTVRLTPSAGAELLRGTEKVAVDPSTGCATVALPITLDGSPLPPVALTAKWTESELEQTLTAYFRSDRPAENDPKDFTLAPDSVGDEPWPWVSALRASSSFARWSARLPAKTAITVTGYSEFDPPSYDKAYSEAVSRRRATGLRDLLAAELAAKTPTFADPVAAGNAAAVKDWSDDQDRYRLARYGRAEAKYTLTAPPPPTVVTATLTRVKPFAPVVKDPPSGKIARRDFVRRLGLTLRLAQSTVLEFELDGEVDFQTAAEKTLQEVVKKGTSDPAKQKQLSTLPSGDPAIKDDGVVDFDLVISHDDSTGEWREALTLRAGAGETDGLWRVPRHPVAITGKEPWSAVDLLGLFLVLAPLTSKTPAATSGGDIVTMAVDGGVAILLSALKAAKAQSITLYGGELVVRERGSGVEGTLLFDYGVELWLNVSLLGVALITTAPGRPVKVRYGAAGLRLDLGLDGKTRFQPAFDASKGYSIEVNDPGMFKVPGGLGDLLQVLAARIARTNPLALEVDLGLKADLGVVSVDRMRARVPLDPPGPPTITALGVGVDVPSVIGGRGYLAIGKDGFAGSLDLSVRQVNLRVGAALAVQHLEGATGVAAQIHVEWPTPIPLLGTGLGLYGLIGLFAMHYHRIESTTDALPAISWFEKAGKDADNPASVYWGPQLDHWAFGIGAVAGTLEGGTILNLKGMLLVELPGPRVLLLMKANLLSGRPELTAGKPGALIAVVDVSPSGLTIAIGVEWELDPLLKLDVPAHAAFPFANPSAFELDIGGFGPPPPGTPAPATATVFGIFRAYAYLMIHGAGIKGFPSSPPRDLDGLAIATGVRLAVVWGNTDINLYVEASASLDVGVGFAPLQVAGVIRLSGALHLFIVSIEASAELDVSVPPVWIRGDVCGEVDCFFFNVHGCVHFELGRGTSDAVPDLVRGLYLQSRSPARCVGTGVDRPIDAKLPDAPVPIDAIPVLQLEGVPVVDGGTFRGVDAPPWPPKPSLDGGWIKHGPREYRYRIVSLAITPEPTDKKQRPSRFRTRIDTANADLALLDWVPNATPSAFQRSAALTESVKGRWGGICKPAAPPVSLVWTFQAQPVGPSPGGWKLAGAATLDPPGVYRSEVPTGLLSVREPWRFLSAGAAAFKSVAPGRVVEHVVVLDSETGGSSTDVPSRVLAAPFSFPDPVPDSPTAAKLYEAVTAPTLEGQPLLNAVELDTGSLVHLRLLVLVDVQVAAAGPFALRLFNADGARLDQVFPDPRPVGSPADLPSTWLDPAQPYHDAVRRSWAFVSEDPFIGPGWQRLLLDADVPPDARRFQLGTLGGAASAGAPPGFYVAVVEGVPATEATRFGHDSKVRQAEIDTIKDMLKWSPKDRALLVPDKSYTVSLEYSAVARDADTKDDPAWPASTRTQSYTFHTDAKPPRSLEPWVLMTDPMPDDRFHFHAEPVTVVFTTDDVVELFAAYKRTLRAVARASTFEPTPTIAVDKLISMPGVVLTDWEETVGAIVGTDCTGPFESLRHGKATLDFPLRPRTDYIVDLETEDGPIDGLPLFRRSFSTSRYAHAADLAADVLQARVRHRRIAPGKRAALAGLAAEPAASELEGALRAAGLGVVPPPSHPDVVVLWEDGAGGSPPKAAAVLIDAPEPLWRSRLEPKKVPYPGSTDGNEVYYDLVPTLWLQLVEEPGTEPSKIAWWSRDPSGTRTLVLLVPGATGTLDLGLRRLGSKTLEEKDSPTAHLARIQLAAPWAGLS